VSETEKQDANYFDPKNKRFFRTLLKNILSLIYQQMLFLSYSATEQREQLAMDVLKSLLDYLVPFSSLCSS